MTQLSEKAKEARNRYLRRWRANNRDKVKRYNRDYWERIAAAEDQVEGE